MVAAELSVTWPVASPHSWNNNSLYNTECSTTFYCMLLSFQEDYTFDCSIVYTLLIQAGAGNSLLEETKTFLSSFLLELLLSSLQSLDVWETNYPLLEIAGKKSGASLFPSRIWFVPLHSSMIRPSPSWWHTYLRQHLRILFFHFRDSFVKDHNTRAITPLKAAAALYIQLHTP